MNEILFNKYNKNYDNIGCHLNDDNNLIISIDNVKLSTANMITSHLYTKYYYEVSFKSEGFKTTVSFNMKIKDTLKQETIIEIMDYILTLIINQ